MSDSEMTTSCPGCRIGLNLKPEGGGGSGYEDERTGCESWSFNLRGLAEAEVPSAEGALGSGLGGDGCGSDGWPVNERP